MYNLIVTAQRGAWSKTTFELDKSRCITGFSDDDIVAEYSDLSSEAIEKAQKHLTLFCYEDPSNENPRVGFLKAITLRGRTVKLRLEAYEIDETLTHEKLTEIDDQLDFHGGELNRIHWAIKKVDLVGVLNGANIIVPEILRIRSSLGLSHLQNMNEIAEYFRNILVSRATGEGCDPEHYKLLRNFFLSHSAFEDVLPDFIRKCVDSEQYWQFIKQKFQRYQERRDFLAVELASLIDRAGSSSIQPSANIISDTMKLLDFESINQDWKKALSRSKSDPSGAITIARTLLESVCKHILEKEAISFDAESIDLSSLYKEVAKVLNLAPEIHKDVIYKQILGGCSGIINGLGTLRNKLGDAHGKGIQAVKPRPRHAELAVNLAGAMALFLIQTYSERKAR